MWNDMKQLQKNMSVVNWWYNTIPVLVSRLLKVLKHFPDEPLKVLSSYIIAML